MCYTLLVDSDADPVCAPQVMRLRRAVPKIPPKSSVPPTLPLYKNPPLLTHSESTLLQLLIPLHFISSRINTYKKPGGGYPAPGPKVLQLVTTQGPTISPLLVSPSPVYPESRSATLLPRAKSWGTSHLQLTENKAALNSASAYLDAASSISPLLATLTEKHRG
jgi:hypothetical protein